MIDITCIKISCKLPGLQVDLETYLTLHQKGQGHAFHFELYQSIHCKSKAKKRMVQIQNLKPISSNKSIYSHKHQRNLLNTETTWSVPEEFLSILLGVAFEGRDPLPHGLEESVGADLGPPPGPQNSEQSIQFLAQRAVM